MIIVGVWSEDPELELEGDYVELELIEDYGDYKQYGTKVGDKWVEIRVPVEK
jgi:hypothetical protein